MQHAISGEIYKMGQVSSPVDLLYEFCHDLTLNSVFPIGSFGNRTNYLMTQYTKIQIRSSVSCSPV